MREHLANKVVYGWGECHYYPHLQLSETFSGLSRVREENLSSKRPGICVPLFSQPAKTSGIVLDDMNNWYHLIWTTDMNNFFSYWRKINIIDIWNRRKRVRVKSRLISKDQITSVNEHHGNMFRFHYENYEFILNNIKIWRFLFRKLLLVIVWGNGVENSLVTKLH